MATKAQQARSEEQRAHHASRPEPAVAKKKPKKRAWSRAKAHAASKATYAFEPTAPGKRPSRKSTRSGANRARPDSAFNLTEQLRKGAPANRARRSGTTAGKVRGRGDSKAPR
jgi:hypothetical protein